MSEDENSNFDNENEEKEEILLNPTNVKDRIDSILEQLSNLKQVHNRTISRADLVSKLSKYVLMPIKALFI